MRPLRLIALIASTAWFACLAIPGSALAGTYTWSLAADFTAAAPGANPDHDQYGRTPWSYSQGPAGSIDPAGFRQLSAFNPSFRGGLAGWVSDSSPSPEAFVATNPTGSAISSPPATFPPGQISVLPASGRSAAIGWTSPLRNAATLSVTGTVTAEDSGGCPGTTWTLAQSGVQLATGTTSSGTISASPLVEPGASLYLIVSSPLVGYNQACVATGVALQIQASESGAPAVAVNSPAPGSITRGTQPRFAGVADVRFGASNRVTVRVYNGPAATGTPAQTLTATASGGAWSVDPGAALADGVYTVQAEQDTLASPPDIGLSAPVAFIVHNAPPSFELDSPGAKPLRTARPTLTGVAALAPGDDSRITLAIYPGSDETASPVRFMLATANAQGRYSATVTPALADGRYTAVAAQPGPAGATGLSQARTFRVKVHGPTLALDRPASGSASTDQQPSFAGRAGTALGDSTQIEVPLYAGKAARGRLIGKLHVSAVGERWSRRWPRRLPAGTYTAQAVQRDDAGHTSTSVPHTFRILAPPDVIGSVVGLDRAGNASLAVTCTSPADQTCTGTVLILSSANFQPVAGGPIGQLRVLFAYIEVPGGATKIVRRPVSAGLASVLRAHSPLRVRITATFGDLTRRPTVFSALRVLRRR